MSCHLKVATICSGVILTPVIFMGGSQLLSKFLDYKFGREKIQKFYRCFDKTPIKTVNRIKAPFLFIISLFCLYLSKTIYVKTLPIIPADKCSKEYLKLLFHGMEVSYCYLGSICSALTGTLLGYQSINMLI